MSPRRRQIGSDEVHARFRHPAAAQEARVIQRRITMKRTLLFVFSAAALGLQSGFLQASPYPSDAEASYELPALESFAERMARVGETPDVWGVSRRTVQPHDVFPFGGGYIDD
jgi:hypothetical protein